MTVPDLKKIFSTKQNNYILLITLIWIISAYIINPVGEFPLNDDWAYAKNVYNLSELGIFKLSNWPAMTLIAQTLWGVIFCKIFGFSFTVLRFSVLILAWLGSICFFIFVKKISKNNLLAFLSSVILIMNPLYFSLAFTFMTDVPFLVMLLFGFFYFSKYLETLQLKYLLLGTLFAIVATMIRQIGIWLALSYFFTYLLLFKKAYKKLLLSFVLCLVPILFMILYFQLLKKNHMQMENYQNFSDLFKTIKSGDILTWYKWRLQLLFIFHGLFLLPLVMIFLPAVISELKLIHKFVYSIIAVVLALFIDSNSHLVFPESVLFNFGLGAKTLKDTFAGLNLHPLLPVQVMNILYFIGLIGSMACIFLALCTLNKLNLRSRSADGIDKMRIMIIIFISGYLCFLLLDENYFDRYFLPIYSLFLLLIAPKYFKLNTSFLLFSIPLLLIISLFSIGATHDYLSFNKARWKGLNDLHKLGVSSASIDGGFEYNGWYISENYQLRKHLSGSWWFVADDEYLVTRGRYCGYNFFKTYKYWSLLTFKEDSVLILKREECKYDTAVITCSAEEITPDNLYYKTSNCSVLLKNTECRTNNDSKNGRYSVLIDTNHPFVFTVFLKEIIPCERIYVSFWHKNSASNVGVVISAPDVNILYKIQSVSSSSANKWKFFEMETMIPFNYPLDSVQFYLWNHGKNSTLIDDLTIKTYKKSKPL